LKTQSKRGLGRDAMAAADDGLAPPTKMVPVGEGQLRHVTLELTIASGAHMPKADFTGKCDPFCVAHWREQVLQTKTIFKSYSPVWDETLLLQPYTVRGGLPAGVAAQDLPALHVELYDQDEAEREFLGKTELPAELMAKLVLAPQGWVATGSLRFSTPDGSGQLVGENKEPTVVTIAVEILKRVTLAYFCILLRRDHRLFGIFAGKGDLGGGGRPRLWP